MDEAEAVDSEAIEEEEALGAAIVDEVVVSVVGIDGAVASEGIEVEEALETVMADEAVVSVAIEVEAVGLEGTEVEEVLGTAMVDEVVVSVAGIDGAVASMIEGETEGDEVVDLVTTEVQGDHTRRTRTASTFKRGRRLYVGIIGVS